MIDNQVVISEEEKERILREHEQNMAELESRYSYNFLTLIFASTSFFCAKFLNIYSLTLNKLRQKQMLEKKLEQRRAKKMEKLQQKHENENKVCGFCGPMIRDLISNYKYV